MLKTLVLGSGAIYSACVANRHPSTMTVNISEALIGL
jgi:hypothetical protein